ncbi:MAG: response regulator [Alphaproteobacteria bacterium]|nr:response regulator [Alphaproteobacteria bacterium]
MFDSGGIAERGVVIVDETLEVKLWNSWLEHVSGVSSACTKGKQLPDLMPGMGGSVLERHILEAIYTGKTTVVRAQDISQMAWAHDLQVSISPLDRNSLKRLMGRKASPLQAYCMVEFSSSYPMQYKTPDTTLFSPLQAPASVSPKVLLLEGDTEIRPEITSILQVQGCQVCVAKTGTEAIRIIQLSDRFDLFLADICDPHLGGFDAMMQIRSLPSDKGHIPAVALVSDGSFQDRDRLLNAGFSDYFIKPYFKTCLPRVCRNFLGQRQSLMTGEVSHA